MSRRVLFWLLLASALVVTTIATILSIPQMQVAGVPGIDRRHVELTGAIEFGGPQIYTRERLINQRLEDQQWLRDQLTAASNTAQIYDSYLHRIARRALALDVAHPAAGTPEAPEKKSGDTAGAPADRGGKDPVEPMLFEDRFRIISALRENINYRILENQLDDRHDLFGNSIYVLKFDLSVIPPQDSDLRAMVRVQMSPPEMLERSGDALLPMGSDIQQIARDYFTSGRIARRWQDGLNLWLRDLEARLNQAIERDHASFLAKKWESQDFRNLWEFLTTHPLIRSTTEFSRILEGMAPVAERQDFNTIEWLKALRDVEGTNGEIGTRFGDNTEIMLDLISEFVVRRSLISVLGLLSKEVSFSQIASGNQSLYKAQSPLRRIGIAPLDSILVASAGRGGVSSPPTILLRSRYDTILFSRTPDCKPAGYDSQQLMKLQSDLLLFAGQIMDEKEQPRGAVFFRTSLLEANLFGAIFPQVPLQEAILGGIPDRYVTLPSTAEMERFDPTSCRDLKVTQIPSGLFNFVARMRQSESYSYAVLPRLGARAAVEEAINRWRLGLSLAAPGVRLGGDSDDTKQQSTVATKVSIVSFGKTVQTDAGEKPTFGWVLDPGARIRAQGRERPEPIQESVMAILSVPSWWEDIRLQVETAWVDRDGVLHAANGWNASRLDPGKPAVGDDRDRKGIVVNLPSSADGVDAVILGKKRRPPEIRKVDFDVRELERCSSPTLLIPGYRLWRNSRVTLGEFEAGNISVLPNMDGIIAKFGAIDQAVGALKCDKATNVAYKDLKLVVWTSEGSAELASPIRLVISRDSAEIAEDCKAVFARLRERCPQPAAKAP